MCLLTEKLAKVELYLRRPKSLEFVAFFLLETPLGCHTKWTDVNLQLTNSKKGDLTINREKIRPKHNLDQKGRYKSARKTTGVVKVIRRRGEPKVKYLF